MSLLFKLFLLVVTIVGITPRRIPRIKEGTLSDPSWKDPRAIQRDRSSGKHQCKDCVLGNGADGTETETEVSPWKQVSEEHSNHEKDVTNRGHLQEKQNTNKGTRNGKGRHRSNGRTSRVKPFLSMGKIRIRVNNKPVESLTDTGEHKEQAIKLPGHSVRKEHVKKDEQKISGNENLLQKVKGSESVSENAGTPVGSLGNKDSGKDETKVSGYATSEAVSKDVTEKDRESSKLEKTTNHRDTETENSKKMDSKDSSKIVKTDLKSVYRSDEINAETKEKQTEERGKTKTGSTDGSDKRHKKKVIGNNKATVSPAGKKKKNRKISKHVPRNRKLKHDQTEADMINETVSTEKLKGKKSDKHVRIGDTDETEPAHKQKGLDVELTGDMTGVNVREGDKYQKETDKIVLGNADDRWSRPGLSQVPDAARLERRLHPTVDAPIRDIMWSLGNILHLIQGSLRIAEKDYAYVFNSTRWKLMVGVREKLQNLVVQNDEVYDVVLQTSLLTKGIYRRAHERRHNGHALHHAQPLRSKDPAIQTVHLRPLYQKAVEEMKKADELKNFVSTTIRQRNELKLEFIQIQSKAEDALPTHVLYDLSRRAKQAIHTLQSAHTQQDMQDSVGLYGHMNGNAYLNMGSARNLTRAAWEELMHAKRQSMDSKGIANKIYKALHDHVPRTPGYLSFDQTRFELWYKVDIAKFHANDLFNEAANIHMKLSPLLKKSQDVLKNYEKDPLSRQLNRTVEVIRKNNKLLMRVMDTIVRSLKLEHLVRARCEFLDKSGYVAGTELDCDQYIMVVVEGSGGDTEEGSGDIDGVAVDLNTSTINNDTIEITDNTDESLVDVVLTADSSSTDNSTDEPTDDSYESSADMDITDMTDDLISTQDIPDTIFIDDDMEGKPLVFTVDNTVTNKPTNVDVKIDNTIPAVFKSQTTRPAIILPSDSDDEDIIKEAVKRKSTTAKSAEMTSKATSKMTAKTPPETTTKSAPTKTTTHVLTTTTTAATTTTSTTTTTKATTETTTEKKESGGIFSNWFGLADQPMRDDMMETEFIDTSHLSLSHLSLNELIRLKMANYSSISEDLHDDARQIQKQANELSMTWSKVKDRFQRYENSTLQQQALASKWAAEQAAFRAVHDRVQNVGENIDLKFELVMSLTDKAVEKAERKVKTMTERYEARAQQAGESADPVHVKELKDSVAKAKDDLGKISQGIQKVVPSPCKLAEIYDKRIRANISELRSKIEKAKMIASALQVAVKLDGSSYLKIPMKQKEAEQKLLTTRLDMVVKVTDTDGPVAGVETEDSGSFLLRMDDRTPRIMALDKGKYEIDDISTKIELEEDTWYRFIIERIARTFNFTVYDANSTEVLAQTSILFDDDDLKIAQTPPTTVFVGGLSDEYSNYGYWMGCVGSIAVNGQILSLLTASSNGDKLPVCTSERDIYHRQSSLVLDGSGFAHYKLDSFLKSKRINSMVVKFRARSDGLIFMFYRGKLGVHARAVIDDRGLVVHIKLMRGRVLSLTVKMELDDADHSLEIQFMGRPSVTSDGRKENLKQSSEQLGDTDQEELFLGAAPSYNRSLVGCLHSVTINGNLLQLSGADTLQGGFFGTCRHKSCSVFSKDSSSIKRTKIPNAKTIHVAFAFGAVGPLLQYTKEKKFDVTVAVDNTTVEVLEILGEDDQLESMPLQGYKIGDIVVLTVTDEDDKIVISTSADASASVDYEGSKGGWLFVADASDEDTLYSITVGASTEYEKHLQGQIEEVIVEGRSIDLSSQRAESSLGACQLSANPVAVPQGKHDDDKENTC